MSQIEIFYSYSHKDELYREELEKHLSLLKWQGVIDNWTNRRIVAGQEWAGEISKHLDTAQIILLLISPDFLASPYRYSIEMKRAIERHERGEAHVIPIILRSVYWQGAPFGKLQALPKDAKPVKSWLDQDEAFYNVAEGIRKVVEDLKAKLSDVQTKPTEQPIVPSAPLVQPLPENVSQPKQSMETSMNTTDTITSPVNQSPTLNLKEVAPPSLTESSQVQDVKAFQLKHVLTGHSGTINSVAISPDGQTLVSGSNDKTIRVWNIHSGDLLRILKGHAGWIILAVGVLAVAISPDGHTIVSGDGNDHTVRIWNLHSGKLLHTLKDHENFVYSVAISPDGHTIVSGGYDKTVRIWNLHSGELLRTLTGHESSVSSVAISPDGHTIVSGSDDKTVRIWNLHSGVLLNTLTGHEHCVSSVAISSDGHAVVSGSYDKTVRIWNFHSGELLQTLIGHTDWVNSVAISPDGQTIVSGSDDGPIRIWSLNSVAISPDGQTIVSGSDDGPIRIWSL